MNPKKQVLKFIQEAYANAREQDASCDGAASESGSSESEIIQELFDGMSTGTARILVEQEISWAIGEKYDIDPMENRSRYYVAKILRSDGSLIQQLLVDKQTGSVRMAGR